MKNKLTALILIVTLLLSFTEVSNASAKVDYTSITAKGTLNTMGNQYSLYHRILQTIKLKDNLM